MSMDKSGRQNSKVSLHLNSSLIGGNIITNNWNKFEQKSGSVKFIKLSNIDRSQDGKIRYSSNLSVNDNSLD